MLTLIGTDPEKPSKNSEMKILLKGNFNKSTSFR